MILCLIYHSKHTKVFKDRKVYDINLFTFGLFNNPFQRAEYTELDTVQTLRSVRGQKW